MRLLLGLTAALSLAGCINFGEQVRQRASFDFNCPEPSIAIQALGMSDYGAAGCGKRATYTVLDNAGGVAVTTPPQTDGPAPTAPGMGVR